MPTKVTDVDILKEHINEAIGMSDAALALLGAIVWKKDIEAIAVSSKRANTQKLTIKLNGVKYVFTCDSKARLIDMHTLTGGARITSFSSQTPASEVRRVFESL